MSLNNSAKIILSQIFAHQAEKTISLRTNLMALSDPCILKKAIFILQYSNIKEGKIGVTIIKRLNKVVTEEDDIKCRKLGP